MSGEGGQMAMSGVGQGVDEMRGLSKKGMVLRPLLEGREGWGVFEKDGGQ